MDFILRIVFYLCLCAGVQCVLQLTWLPCHFIDEQIYVNENNRMHVNTTHREATLQFGQDEDPPLNSLTVTFLVTVSKLDIRRYIEGTDKENLECELRRHIPTDCHVRWPVQAASDHNFWFISEIKHRNGQFALTSVLRQPSVQPSSSQGNRNSPAILDGDVLTIKAVMVVKSQTPVIKAGIGLSKKLHCQFAVDHKMPKATVEWIAQFHGERKQMLSRTSRTWNIKGRDVDVKSLAGGDVSHTIPYTKATSDGRYICSVSASPVFASVDINLQIEVPPRVTLKVKKNLRLTVGQQQRISCEAGGYYPRDVDIVWHEQDPAVSGQRVGAPLPTVLKNTLLSSHMKQADETYTVTSFFYLTASLSDTGKQYTCIVSHRSLSVPIRESFTLNVVEPTSWGFTFTVIIIITVLLATVRKVCKRTQEKWKPRSKKPD